MGIFWLVLLTATLSSVITVRMLGSDVSTALAGSVYANEDIARYAKLEEVRSIISEQYYIEVDDDTLIEGAIRGMLDSLDDRYSFYYSKEDMEERTKETTGEYKGLGVSITFGDANEVIISNVYRNTPASGADICVGDILTAVNGEPVSASNSFELDGITEMIAGFGDDYFELTLMRAGSEYTCTVRREHVVINRVEYALLEDDIGYIQITDFLGDDVAGFSEALESFAGIGLKGLVIDLRNNTGGYLDDVVYIADRLLPEGLIIYTEDRYGKIMEERSDAECIDCPVAVLVNRMSASASEVLSGAIQDHGKGVIIGTQTYGKGIVQTVLDFDDGSGMQLTTSRYYTPSGRCIHGVGITPDIESEDDPETEADEVLEAALEWFASGAPIG